MSKNYLDYEIKKVAVTDDDFEELKLSYEEDEIDYIRMQMELGETEYPRVDKFVCDDLTIYLLLHSINEKSVELAYITLTAKVDGMPAATAKFVQVGSTFSNEESGDVLKVLRELLQEQYSAMRQFLFGAHNLEINSTVKRSETIIDALSDADSEGEHKGCLSALLFEILYVFPRCRQQHVYETLLKVVRGSFGQGVGLCFSTLSSGQQVDPALAKIAAEKTGLTVSNDFMHLSLDENVEFAYYLDDELKAQATAFHISK